MKEETKDPSKGSVTIVYNNIPGDARRHLLPAPGFSAFIQLNDRHLLFDVGGDTSIFLNNIEALGIDIAHLDAVVISHDHWDHVYGMPALASHGQRSLRVYVPASSKESISVQNPRLKVVPVSEPTEIFAGTWSTGPVAASYAGRPIAEQALVLMVRGGAYVVTGCAHPGIVAIVERVREIVAEQAILLVAGGMHLIDSAEQTIRDISSKLRQLGVRRLAPSHCTGSRAIDIFREEWGGDYVDLCLGHTLAL